MYKKLEKLKLIRRSLEAGNLLGIALRNSGIRSYYTLNLWRQKNPRIDRYITVCLVRQNDKRTDAVEDAHFKKMIDGNGSAADYIFYLCNRRPEKWQNRHQFEHFGLPENKIIIINNGQPTKREEFIQRIKTES